MKTTDFLHHRLTGEMPKEKEIKKVRSIRSYPSDIELIEKHYGTLQAFYDAAVEEVKEALSEGELE